MSIKPTRFQKAIELIPEDLTAEDLSREGELAYDSVDDKLKYRDSSVTREVVNTNEAQSLENKTIDATAASGNNTISMDSDDVSYDNTTSGLTATNVKDAVDELKTGLDNQNEASEIDYDNTTSGLAATNVQAAIDEVEGRVDGIEGASYVNSFNTRTGAVVPAASDYDANQIDYDNATSGLAATDAQAAIDEVEGRLDTAETNISTNSSDITTNASNLTDHLNDAVDAHDASAISYVNTTSGLTATEVQAAIDEVEARVETNEAHVAANSDVHGIGVGNEVVGTGTQQVLTDKDYDGGTASNTSRLTLPSDTKANLDLLTRKEGTLVYATDEDLVYYDNGSILVPVGSGQGSGGINYITNPGAEADLSDWNDYANAASEVPVDGILGSPTSITLSRNTVDPLRDDADFQLAKSATNGQGEGVSTNFTVDIADQAQKLLISFNYDTTNVNYADGDIRIYVYDIVNGNIIRVNGEDLLGGQGTHYALFQTASNSRDYRLIFHVATTNATAYTINFDNVSVGPVNLAFGSIETDEESYTPTLGGSPSVSGNVAYWKRSGDSLFVRGRFFVVSGGSGILTISLPPGLSADTSKFSVISDTNVGTGYWNDAGTGFFTLNARGNSTTNVAFFRDSDIGSFNASSLAVNDTVTYTFRVPIAGWSSNSIQSQDLGGREVKVTATGNGNLSLTSGVTDIPFLTASKDTTASWSGSVFTSPEKGLYDISGSIRVTTSANADLIGAYVNGVLVGILGNSVLSGTGLYWSFSGKIELEKGDVFSLRMLLNGTGTLVEDVVSHRIEIKKLSSPQTMLETETVAMRATSNSGQALGTGLTNIIYEDLDYDTHGAYNTSTGVFTAPISDKYRITAKFRGNTSEFYSIAIEKNGTRVCQESSGVSNNTSVSIQDELDLARGDTVEIVGFVSSTATNLSTTDLFNVVSISRIK